MNKSMWRIQAGAVLKGMVLLTLAGLVGSGFDAAGSINDRVDLARSFMTGNFDDYFKPDGWDFASGAMMLLEIFGYILYLGGLKRFASLLPGGDAASVMKVRTGAILTVIGVVVGHVPVLGWLPKLVLVIVGFVKMLGGYKRLSYSSTFPATHGASTLHSALIVQLIGVLLGLLPVVGGVIESIADIIVFFMVISGWLTIKNTVFPVCFKTVPEVDLLPFGKIPGGRMLSWGVGIYFVGILMVELMWVFYPIIRDYLVDNNYRDLLYTISFYMFWLEGIAFGVYIIGIGKAWLYRRDRGIRGILLVMIALSLLGIIETANPSLHSVLIPDTYEQTAIENFDSYYNTCFNFLRCIAWVVCALGFIRNGKTGHYGYMGKHGVVLLTASAWIYGGVNFIYILDALSKFQLLGEFGQWLGMSVNIICFILILRGWRLLLSSWYGESDADLPELTAENVSGNYVEVKETSHAAPRISEDGRKEYAEALLRKSDEELKELIRDEKMYDATFIAAAREELTNRVLGKMTAHNTATNLKNE